MPSVAAEAWWAKLWWELQIQVPRDARSWSCEAQRLGVYLEKHVLRTMDFNHVQYVLLYHYTVFHIYFRYIFWWKIDPRPPFLGTLCGINDVILERFLGWWTPCTKQQLVRCLETASQSDSTCMHTFILNETTSCYLLSIYVYNIYLRVVGQPQPGGDENNYFSDSGVSC